MSHHHCLGGLWKRYTIDLKGLHMKVQRSPLTYLSTGCSHQDISLPNRQYWRPYSTPITHRTHTGKIDFKTTVSAYTLDVYNFMLISSKNETIFRKETQDLSLESARCIQGTPPLNSLAVASGFLKYPEMEKRRRGRKIVLEYMWICIWMYMMYMFDPCWHMLAQFEYIRRAKLKGVTNICSHKLRHQQAATSRSSIFFGQGSLHDSIAAHDNFANCPHSADKSHRSTWETVQLYDMSSIPRNKRNKHANMVGTCFFTSSGVLVANRVSVHPVVPVFGFPDQWPPNIPTSGGG